DALFPKVRFVGPSGRYEAGVLVAESLHELPRDGLPIVLCLLTWNPTDPRLFWLYGELLNAEGQIHDAYLALDNLRYARRIGTPELHQHRQILLEAVERLPKDDGRGGKAMSKPSPPFDEKPADKSKTNWLPDWKTLGAGFL